MTTFRLYWHCTAESLPVSIDSPSLLKKVVDDLLHALSSTTKMEELTLRVSADPYHYYQQVTMLLSFFLECPTLLPALRSLRLHSYAGFRNQTFVEEAVVKPVKEVQEKGGLRNLRELIFQGQNIVSLANRM